MKRILTLVLSLVLMLALVPLAQAQDLPEEKKPVVTQLEGAEISFHSYDTKIYETECDQPGTIEKIEYTTDVYGDPIRQWANVYLPYGYDPAQEYNIIYFTHGTNETQDSFIMEDVVKNAIDNMIALHVCDPFIMVCPTYYYDYETRATDHEVFVEEVRKDLMPAVESRYSTYAKTADPEGFIASRTHRAFCGYSQGGSVCWTISFGMYDYAKWFVPLSGTFGDVTEQIKDAMARYPEYADDIFYIICSGGKRDLAYEGTVAALNAMLQDDTFSFGTDTEKNNFFAAISKDLHQTLKGRFMLYSVFVDVLFK
ncbi:MAG: hypothetical protein IJ083_04405 [Clostridia bacterium]|nr:hypothetical protein [Clostridia bacterium]